MNILSEKETLLYIVENNLREEYSTRGPKFYLEREGMIVFEKALKTPFSFADIEWCIKKEPDIIYEVRNFTKFFQ